MQVQRARLDRRENVRRPGAQGQVQAGHRQPHTPQQRTALPLQAGVGGWVEAGWAEGERAGAGGALGTVQGETRGARAVRVRGHGMWGDWAGGAMCWGQVPAFREERRSVNTAAYTQSTTAAYQCVQLPPTLLDEVT